MSETAGPDPVYADDEREITVQELLDAANDVPDSLCLARGAEYIDGVLHLTGRCVFTAGHDDNGPRGGHSWDR